MKLKIVEKNLPTIFLLPICKSCLLECIAEEEDTQRKCTKLIYDVITHYFKEFEDSTSDISTFFFVDPDQGPHMKDGFYGDSELDHGALMINSSRAGTPKSLEDSHALSRPQFRESEAASDDYGYT